MRVLGSAHMGASPCICRQSGGECLSCGAVVRLFRERQRLKFDQRPKTGYLSRARGGSHNCQEAGLNQSAVGAAEMVICSLVPKCSNVGSRSSRCSACVRRYSCAVCDRLPCLQCAEFVEDEFLPIQRQCPLPRRSFAREWRASKRSVGAAVEADPMPRKVIPVSGGTTLGPATSRRR
jgi:hypothetical protein